MGLVARILAANDLDLRQNWTFHRQAAATLAGTHPSASARRAISIGHHLSQGLLLRLVLRRHDSSTAIGQGSYTSTPTRHQPFELNCRGHPVALAKRSIYSKKLAYSSR